MTPAEAIAVAVLAGLHLVADRLRFVDAVPRSRWLSAAGGAAIAYVFVHLLPELAEADRALSETGVVASLERHAYLVALVGLGVFYGLEHAASSSRHRRRHRTGEDRAGGRVLALHAASFGAYNALVGYLIVHRVDEGPGQLALFSLAMAVHFVIADASLRRHHRDAYRRVVRWILVLALAGGLLAGAATEISDAAVALLLAFLAGGVILETLKEEVPGERQARFLPFAAGAAGYSAVLLLV